MKMKYTYVLYISIALLIFSSCRQNNKREITENNSCCFDFRLLAWYALRLLSICKVCRTCWLCNSCLPSQPTRQTNRNVYLWSVGITLSAIFQNRVGQTNVECCRCGCRYRAYPFSFCEAESNPLANKFEETIA